MNEALIKNVFQKVLKEIVPSQSERKKVNNIINFAKEKINQALSKHKIEAEVIVGGSVAKDTWLHNNHDIDFFVKFDTKYKDQDIGKILGTVLKSSFGKIKTLHGTRDYYHVFINKYKFEIVPVLAISNPKEAKNSIDVSPFHVDYVKKKLNQDPQLSNQIRLFKKFAHSQGVYGAETFVSGFSGYVCELLIINYGSFLNLINAWENAKPKIVIDIEKQFLSTEEIISTLPESKTNSPIILIDPVLKERNACAALDYKTFSKMLFALRLFLRKPSTSFFKKKSTTINIIKKLSKKHGTILVYYKLKKQGNQKDDVYMSKIKSRLERIITELGKNNIEVYNYGFTEDNFAFIELETIKLSKQEKHYGPYPWIEPKFFDQFIKKWPKAYVWDTNLVVDIQRPFKDIRSFVLKLLKEELGNV